MKELKSTFLILVMIGSALTSAFLYANIRTGHSSYGYVPGYEAHGGE
jgi:hypothetical protein